MQWLITEEQLKALSAWEVNDKPALQTEQERADMAKIIVGLFYDGMYTEREMLVALEKCYGKR